jgi:hypothetical protein
MGPLGTVTHRSGGTARSLANLGPPSTFSLTLVGVRQDVTGLELHTVTHSGGTVTDVPVMPRKRSRVDVYNRIVRPEPDRESLIREIADYVAVTRCNDWTAPIGNQVLALIDSLPCIARARRQPPARR